MKSIIYSLSFLSLALFIQAVPLTIDEHWQQFKVQHGRLFSNVEARKAAFVAAKAAVDQHNAEADQGMHTYYQTVNQFAVMTEQEMKSYTGFNFAKPVSKSAPMTSLSRVTPPASMDMRTCQCMPAIKNQGSCGSCWTFSSINPIEVQYCCLNSLPAPTLFSEQLLLDCSITNGGCKGGDMSYAWQELINNGTLVVPSSQYPYKASKGTCKYNATLGLAKLSNLAIIGGTDSGVVLRIQQALTQYGPVSVALYASSSFRAYKSGVFTSTTCTPNANHAVVVVGYGTLNALDYWIVRNSWGTGFGSSGYILMQRGVNLCHVEEYAMYPVVAA